MLRKRLLKRMLPGPFVSSLIAILLISGALSRQALAQTATSGALTVNVKDRTGAVVPGAVVTVSNSSGLARSNQTNATDGSYTFTLLPPGEYKVTVASAGFNNFEAPAVPVDVSQTAVLNATLQVGTQSQEVQVTANALAIQTESSQVGGVVGQVSIESLPLVTRNYLQIMNLSPGVGTDVSNSTAIGAGLQAIFVNGKDNADSIFQLDGVDISAFPGGGEGTSGFSGESPTVSPDALQEFTVLTSNYDASYGKHSGANVNVITRSGTDAMHGTAFEYLRNTVLNANTFFLKQGGKPRGALSQNQYGGTLGGPIKKGKLYYFLSYEGTGQKNGIAAGSSTLVTLPEQLTNDRSLLTLENEFCYANPSNQPGQPGYPYAHTVAYTPAQGQQLTCPSGGPAGQGTVPVPLDTPGGLSSVAYYVMNAKLADGTYQIPTPTRIVTTASGTIGQAALSSPATYWDKQALGNIDYRISPKNSLSLHYMYDISLQHTPYTNGVGSSVQPAPNGGQRINSGGQLAAIKLTTIVSPNIVNQGMFSHWYMRGTLNSTSPTTMQQAGMTPPTTLEPTINMPQITITGLTNLYGGFADSGATPAYYDQWQDQLSWQRGRHSLRFGFNWQNIDFHECTCENNGNFVIPSFADFLLGESAAENGTAASGPNVSNIQRVALILQIIPDNFLTHYTGSFVQDDIKVSRKLTVNMGLRWEYLGTQQDLHRLGGTNGNYALALTVPDPGPNGTYVGWTAQKDYNGPALPAGVVRRSTDLFTDGRAPMNNWGPRLGVAWQPAGQKLVFRAGSGIFYDISYGNQMLQTGQETVPNAASLGYTGTGAALATLDNPFNPAVQLYSWASALRVRGGSQIMHSIDPHLVNPMTFSWNADAQYQLAPSTVLDIGYVGNRAEHGFGEDLENIPTLATATNPVNCNTYIGCQNINTPANAANRVPVLGFGVADVQTLKNIGDSNYNSLQLSLQQRLSHGLQFQFSYTWGRCFNNLVGQAGGAGLYDNSNLPTDRRQMYGPCDFVRPQRFVTNWLYNLPGFKSENGFVNKATSGWSVSGVVQAQNGYPLTIVDPTGGAVYGMPDAGTSQVANFARAQFCPGQNRNNVPTIGNITGRLTHYFNSGVFCAEPIVGVVNGLGGGTGFGNSGRGIVSGPGQFNWDVSLVKSTVVGGLSEDARLEFRSEFFNLFNHPQFGNPVTAVTSSAFGVITSTLTGPRVIQFALRYAF